MPRLKYPHENNETKCSYCRKEIILNDDEVINGKYTCPECGKKNRVTKISDSKLIISRPIVSYLAKHPNLVIALEYLVFLSAVYYGYETGYWMLCPLAGGIADLLYKKYIKPYK